MVDFGGIESWISEDATRCRRKKLSKWVGCFVGGSRGVVRKIAKEGGCRKQTQKDSPTTVTS